MITAVDSISRRRSSGKISCRRTCSKRRVHLNRRAAKALVLSCVGPVVIPTLQLRFVGPKQKSYCQFPRGTHLDILDGQAGRQSRRGTEVPEHRHAQVPAATTTKGAWFRRRWSRFQISDISCLRQLSSEDFQNRAHQRHWINNC